MNISFYVADGLYVCNVPQFIVEELKSLSTHYLEDLSTETIETFASYEETFSGYKFPRGLEEHFYNLLEHYSLKVTRKKNLKVQSNFLNYKPLPHINYSSGVYGYQEKVCQEAIKHTTGRIKAPPGAGKTVISCLIPFLLNKGPVLFLANRNTLLRQFRRTVKKVYGVPLEEVGLIQQDKKIIKPFTCGSLQTIGKESFDIESIKYTFNTVFVDESHISSTAPTYRRVLLNLAPERMYGLSATPFHNSNEEVNKLMYALLGPVIAEVPEKVIPGRIKPIIYYVNTNCNFPYSYQRSDPQNLKFIKTNQLNNKIVKHNSRNNLIIKYTLELLEKGFKVLICVDRVKHGAVLTEMLKNKSISVSFPYKESDMSPDENLLTKDVEEILDGNIDVLIGTYKRFGEGFDCENLSAVIFAGPVSGSNTNKIEQVVGRIQRYLPEKKHAIVIDLFDSSYPSPRLDNWASKRYDFFQKKYGNIQELN